MLVFLMSDLVPIFCSGNRALRHAVILGQPGVIIDAAFKRLGQHLAAGLLVEVLHGVGSSHLVD